MELSNTPKSFRLELEKAWSEPDQDCDECCDLCREEGTPIESMAKSLMNDCDYNDIKQADEEVAEAYGKWVESLPEPSPVTTEMITATKIAKDADIEIAKINKESNVEVAKINAEAQSCCCCLKTCKEEKRTWSTRRRDNKDIAFRELTLLVHGNLVTITEEDLEQYAGDNFWQFSELESGHQVLNILFAKLLKKLS